MMCIQWYIVVFILIIRVRVQTSITNEYANYDNDLTLTCGIPACTRLISRTSRVILDRNSRDRNEITLYTPFCPCGQLCKQNHGNILAFYFSSYNSVMQNARPTGTRTTCNITAQYISGLSDVLFCVACDSHYMRVWITGTSTLVTPNYIFTNGCTRTRVFRFKLRLTA
jgi:hypothetical protein